MLKKSVLPISLLALGLVSIAPGARAEIVDVSAETNQTKAVKQNENDQDASAILADEGNQDESEKQKKDDQIASDLKTVLAKYKSILDLDLKYDLFFEEKNEKETTGEIKENQEEKENENKNNSDNSSSLIDLVYSDCEYVEKNKKGTGRHFSNYLLKELRDAGIEAYPLYTIDIFGMGYQAVLYKAGGELFVADITYDIVMKNANKSSSEEEPLFFAYKLEDFIKERKEYGTCCIFYLDADLTDRNIELDGEAASPKIKVLYDVTLENN